MENPLLKWLIRGDEHTVDERREETAVQTAGESPITFMRKSNSFPVIIGEVCCPVLSTGGKSLGKIMFRLRVQCKASTFKPSRFQISIHNCRSEVTRLAQSYDNSYSDNDLYLRGEGRLKSQKYFCSIAEEILNQRNANGAQVELLTLNEAKHVPGHQFPVVLWTIREVMGA